MRFARDVKATRAALEGELMALNLETVLKAASIFLDLYTLDLLAAGTKRLEGTPETVIRAADAGPAVMRGVHDLCERLINERNNPRKEES